MIVIGDGFEDGASVELGAAAVLLAADGTRDVDGLLVEAQRTVGSLTKTDVFDILYDLTASGLVANAPPVASAAPTRRTWLKNVLGGTAAAIAGGAVLSQAVAKEQKLPKLKKEHALKSHESKTKKSAGGGSLKSEVEALLAPASRLRAKKERLRKQIRREAFGRLGLQHEQGIKSTAAYRKREATHKKSKSTLIRREHSSKRREQSIKYRAFDFGEAGFAPAFIDLASGGPVAIELDLSCTLIPTSAGMTGGLHFKLAAPTAKERAYDAKRLAETLAAAAKSPVQIGLGIGEDLDLFGYLDIDYTGAESAAPSFDASGSCSSLVDVTTAKGASDAAVVPNADGMIDLFNSSASVFAIDNSGTGEDPDSKAASDVEAALKTSV